MPLVFNHYREHTGAEAGWNETQSGIAFFDHLTEQMGPYIDSNKVNLDI